RKNAQALFVRYISGWTFVGAYRSLLALEGALALALVGGGTGDTWSKSGVLRDLEAAGMPPPPTDTVPLDGGEPAAMLAITVLGAAVTITVLAGSHGRSLRQVAIEE
ncbi:hypothetical protein, partial [Staphylococcus aureus]|uniref:hypothetical protein n=1 Tax=Staphylococcus aureus TaxID=1280 RepID=UPI001A9151A0